MCNTTFSRTNPWPVANKIMQDLKDASSADDEDVIISLFMPRQCDTKSSGASLRSLATGCRNQQFSTSCTLQTSEWENYWYSGARVVETETLLVSNSLSAGNYTEVAQDKCVPRRALVELGRTFPSLQDTTKCKLNRSKPCCEMKLNECFSHTSITFSSTAITM